MMRILVAPERFYPTMKAQAVAQAMMRGLQQVSPQYEMFMYPLASGGSGTTDLAVRLAKGRIHHETIPVPNRRPRDVKWGSLPDGTAIFDAKDALGNPDGPSRLENTYSDSRPLGLMIQRLLSYKPTRIAIALGDVLAADGGMGLLQFFGISSRNQEGLELSSGTRDLLHLHQVDFSHLAPPSVPLLGLTDLAVTWNARVQQADFRLDLIHGGLMSAAMRLVGLLAEHIRVPLADMPGTGVGGGLGMALAFLGAQFQPGAEFLKELGNLRELIWNVDWVMTGTSELDDESVHQAAGVVALLARDAGVPAVALAVSLKAGHLRLYDAGLSGISSVLDRPRSEKDVHRALPALIEKAAYRTGIWMESLSDGG